MDDSTVDLIHFCIFAIAQALEEGYSIERIVDLTKIDSWFIGKLKNIVDYKAKLQGYNSLEELPAEVLREAKFVSLISRLPALY